MECGGMGRVGVRSGAHHPTWHPGRLCLEAYLPPRVGRCSHVVEMCGCMGAVHRRAAPRGLYTLEQAPCEVEAPHTEVDMSLHSHRTAGHLQTDLHPPPSDLEACLHDLEAVGGGSQTVLDRET